MKVYVASSWRNPAQPGVVRVLRQAGIDAYDFREPGPGQSGFSWREIAPDWQHWSPAAFRDALSHPVARAGFDLDFAAMRGADACVLVLPCGRSAHLGAGWFVGAGKPLYVLLADGEPELMYRLALETGGTLCLTVEEILGHLFALQESRVGAVNVHAILRECLAEVLAWLRRPPGGRASEAMVARALEKVLAHVERG